MYRVEHRYHAVDNGAHVGPWVGGELVDLDEERAAWVNRDSPGTLAPVAVEQADQSGEGEAGESPARPRSGRPAATAPGKSRPTA